MLSIESSVSVPEFPAGEIGPWTLVRAYPAKLQLNVTNDGQTPSYRLNVRPVVESYVGQEKPLLFLWSDTQVVEQVPPKGMVPLTFNIQMPYPGLVAVAVYLTDSANKAVMAKRKSDSTYQELPVRWWFHVIDDISIETLRALRDLAAQWRKEAKK